MLLAVDVGNTNIVLGVFAGDRLVESWRVATLRERTADELGLITRQLLEHRGIGVDQIAGVVVSSVVPPLTGTVLDVARRDFGQDALLVDTSLDLGMPIRYQPPGDVGADRIVNAIAARHRYAQPDARPLIVVDFGTATTFDVVSVAGEYLGGVICPGVQISADALFQRAARLPRVDVRRPPQVVGGTTVHAMQSGLFYGYVGLVEGLVARIRSELGESTRCIATGGLADVLAGDTRGIDAVDRDLTLAGLRLIWDRHGARAPR